MSDFIIEKIVSEQEVVSNPTRYQVKYIRELEKVDGTKVVVVDEDRTQQVTVEQLDEQIASYQAQIDELSAKKTAIIALEAPVVK